MDQEDKICGCPVADAEITMVTLHANNILMVV